MRTTDYQPTKAQNELYDEMQQRIRYLYLQIDTMNTEILSLQWKRAVLALEIFGAKLGGVVTLTSNSKNGALGEIQYVSQKGEPHYFSPKITEKPIIHVRKIKSNGCLSNQTIGVGANWEPITGPE